MPKKSKLLRDPNQPKRARILRRSTIFLQDIPAAGLVTFPPREIMSTEAPVRASASMAADDADPNFEYFITANGITVETLLINSVPFTDPGAHGNVFVPVFVDTIQVIVDATLFNPVGSGTLQLKFLNTDVFAVPEPFEFDNSGGGGLNLADVPLPL